MTTTKKPKKKQGKRADGEGSVFQRSDGRWIASTPRDPRTGARQRFTAATQAEAIRKRTEAQQRRDAAGGVVTKDPTIEGYLRHWLDTVAKDRVRESTLDSYRSKVETCIIPTIGKLKLSKVLPTDVRSMMNAVVAGAGKSRGEKRSPRTANYCRTVLAKALDDARKDRVLIGDNAARLADPLAHKRPKTAWLSADDVQQLAKQLEGHRDRALFLFTALTGVRQGEALGLRWSDLVLDGATPLARLEVQLQTVKKQRVLVDLKTEQSKRVLPLAGNLVALLKAHKATQARRRLELGDLWADKLGLVFPETDGSPGNENRLRRAFRRVLADAGLQRVRFHDLRHSAASLMLERNGGDLKAVSVAMGHSGIVITADTYSHVRDAILARTTGALDDLIAGTK